MGLRFRRSIRILPGIRINLSKSGISTSIGRRGAHVTMGHGKVRETVGLPGSGLSYTHIEGSKSGEQAAELPQTPVKPSAARGWLWFALLAIAAWALWRAVR